jgi:hypothetical protein
MALAQYDVCRLYRTLTRRRDNAQAARPVEVAQASPAARRRDNRVSEIAHKPFRFNRLR